MRRTSFHTKMPNTRQPLLAFSLLIIIYSLATNFIIVKTNTTYYILHWGSPLEDPYSYLGDGHSPFLLNNCKHTNCYVTKNRSMYPEMSKFDAILFDVVDLVSDKKSLPTEQQRSPKQKYIFTSTENSAMYPLCELYFNNFFNWTWTYRLDSDFRRGYLTVYNLGGKRVGPKKNKKWPHVMKPINEKLKSKLQYKTELAAYFVSNCSDKDARIQFVNKVQEVLTELGESPVDIFGRCGRYECPHRSSKCVRMLQRDYYFYMAFENSFARDYITEKVLTALDNYNVPVVYGSADYTTLLPPGSYLNAWELGPDRLARRMVEIKNNVTAYYDFFRWRNHFKYKQTAYSDDTCAICDMMNDDRKRTTSWTYRNFTNWWNEGGCGRET